MSSSSHSQSADHEAHNRCKGGVREEACYTNECSQHGCLLGIYVCLTGVGCLHFRSWMSLYVLNVSMCGQTLLWVLKALDQWRRPHCCGLVKLTIESLLVWAIVHCSQSEILCSSAMQKCMNSGTWFWRFDDFWDTPHIPSNARLLSILQSHGKCNCMTTELMRTKSSYI